MKKEGHAQNSWREPSSDLLQACKTQRKSIILEYWPSARGKSACRPRQVQHWSLYSANMCRPEIPALYRQPTLLRILPLLVVPVCAKRFTGTIAGNRHCRGTVTVPDVAEAVRAGSGHRDTSKRQKLPCCRVGGATNTHKTRSGCNAVRHAGGRLEDERQRAWKSSEEKEGGRICMYVCFFFSHTTTFQLLDRPWSQVSPRLPPPFLPSTFIAQGFSNPTARPFFIECC